MTSHLSTHVLDARVGGPAAGIAVVLEGREGNQWVEVADGTTDTDGRIGELGPQRLSPGTYRLSFAVAAYFAATGTASFYPEVTVTFEVDDAAGHYHVPLLLSPYAYSTYRGT